MREYNKAIPEKYTPLGRGFVTAALELVNAKDGWEKGGEGPEGADCSGVLSWAFTRCGFPIRMTANGFYQNLFHEWSTHDWPDSQGPEICAVFFITTETTDFLGKYPRAAGDAIHVSPRVGMGVFLDTNYYHDRIELVTLQHLLDRYCDTKVSPVFTRAHYTAVSHWAGYGRDLIDEKAFQF